jgi:hypothetical protein
MAYGVTLANGFSSQDGSSSKASFNMSHTDTTNNDIMLKGYDAGPVEACVSLDSSISSSLEAAASKSGSSVGGLCDSSSSSSSSSEGCGTSSSSALCGADDLPSDEVPVTQCRMAADQQTSSSTAVHCTFGRKTVVAGLLAALYVLLSVLLVMMPLLLAVGLLQLHLTSGITTLPSPADVCVVFGMCLLPLLPSAGFVMP